MRGGNQLTDSYHLCDMNDAERIHMVSGVCARARAMANKPAQNKLILARLNV